METIRTRRNITPDPGIVNDQPSLTVKDDSMTIKQIIEKYRAGARPDQRNFVFLDNEDLSTINEFYRAPGALDYTDIERLITRNKETLRKVQKMQDDLEKEKADILEKNPDLDKDKDGKIDDKKPKQKTEEQ